MSAVIKIQGIEATCRDYEWFCGDPTIMRQLTETTLSEFGPSPADPNPDHTAAIMAVRELGAELISFDEAPELIEGVVY